MKNFLPVVILFSFLFSCKKHVAEGESVKSKLVSIRNADPITPTVYTTQLEYDAQKRIVKVVKQTNGVTNLISTITYANNQIIINRPVNGNIIEDDITYTVDGNGMPLKRIRRAYSEVNNPGFIAKYITFDTAIYEYASSGLLSKTISYVKDSSDVDNSGTHQLSTFTRTETTLFTNEGNRLKNSFSKSVVYGIHRIGNNITNSTSLYEKSNTYEYLKSYPNKMDYANMVVLNECVYTYFIGFFMNKNLSNLPDRMIYYNTIYDVNGVGNRSADYITKADLEFDSYGYLSTVKGLDNNYTPSSTTTFTYTR